MSAPPPPAGPGSPVPARTRPLSVAVAFVFCLPAIVLAGPGGEPDRPVLAAVAIITLAEVVNRSLAGRVGLAARTRIGVAVVAATLVLLLIATARSTLPVPAWLGMVAAASVAAAVVRQVTARVGLQALLVVGAGVLLAVDHPDPGSVTGALSVAGPLVLLVAITVLASALAGDLERARRRHLLTRRAADRRAELLEAVRQLSRADRGEVVDVTVDALRELGFPVAAVLLVDGDRLRARRVEGVDERDDYGGGISAEALRTGRTVVSAEYRTDPRRLPELDIGAVVASPIQADGRSLGVLTVGLPEEGAPAAGDIEVVEVLAAHLGGVLVRERVEENQTILLTRLRELDRLRGDFVDRVSEDLRDPLTVVRGVAQTLAMHGDRLPDVQRAVMLERLTVQSRELSSTLESLLDFSRVQVGHVDPHPEPSDLLELLSVPLAGSNIEVRIEGRPVVVVDRELVRRAVELLRRATLDVSRGLVVEQRAATVTVDVQLLEVSGLQGGFARTLAEQLLVAGGASSERLPDGLRLILPTAPAGGST